MNEQTREIYTGGYMFYVIQTKNYPKRILFALPEAINAKRLSVCYHLTLQGESLTCPVSFKSAGAYPFPNSSINMTKVPETRKPPFGLKPVVILTLAVILLGKPQRVLTDDEVTSVTVSATDPSEATCPDFCNLPADRATRGKAPFRMWYFDPSEGECRRFRWGGRGGNENRFRKKTDCENACSKCLNKTTEDDNQQQDSQEIENGMKDIICSPPKDEGRCNPSDSGSRPIKSPQLAWYFEPTTERCSPFVYFGCGGNSNRFLSRSECEEICI